MDQVFDALCAESPYDRCANEINSSIMGYKNGKDKDLLNGSSDITDKDSTTNRFYNRMKSDIDKIHGSDNKFEIETTGTQIGQYVFNNQNDFVEKASEAFNDKIVKDASWNTIVGTVNSCSRDISSRCKGLIRANSEFNKAFIKLKYNPIDSLPESFKNNSTKLKDVIVNSDKAVRIIKDVYIPKSLSSIGDFLRDSIIATSKINKNYSLRYIDRYNKLKISILEMASSVNYFLKYLNDDKDAFKDLKNSSSKVMSSFKDAIKVSTDYQSDPFTFRSIKYKANLHSFTITPISYDYPDMGITLSDYLFANKEDTAIKNDDTSVFYTSVCGSNSISRIKDKLYASNTIGSGNINLKDSENTDLDLLNITDDDITIGEFYEQVQKYLNNIKDREHLMASITACLNSVLSSLKVIKSAADSLITITSKDFEETAQSRKLVIQMLMHFTCELLFNALSTAESMNACNMIDNVRKMSLLNLTNSLVGCYRNAIQSGLGE